MSIGQDGTGYPAENSDREVFVNDYDSMSRNGIQLIEGCGGLPVTNYYVDVPTKGAGKSTGHLKLNIRVFSCNACYFVIIENLRGRQTCLQRTPFAQHLQIVLTSARRRRRAISFNVGTQSGRGKNPDPERRSCCAPPLRKFDSLV